MEKRKKILHIIGSVVIWIIFISLPRFGLPGSVSDYLVNEFQVIHYLINCALLIIIFYVNLYFGIPKIFHVKRYGLYLLFLIAIVGFRIITYSVLDNVIPSLNEVRPPKPMAFTYKMVSNMLVLAASFAIYYYNHFNYIETEKNKAELLALKRQINPHFLFNTLNVIYGQAINKSDKTADSVAKLSAMMRYVISDAHQEMVWLEKELNYIKSYIDLQKQRLTEKTTIQFKISGDTGGIKIPALILVNYIENAFKYGVSNEVETVIEIYIELKNKILLLTVKNNKPHTIQTEEESAKIGMSNTLKRLKLIYGENFNLIINNRDDLFEVKLKILFND